MLTTKRFRVTEIITIIFMAIAAIMVFANVNTKDASAANSVAEEMITIINNERAANGLSPLMLLAEFNEMAIIRAEESAELFSHTRPDGTDVFDLVIDSGLWFDSLGENLALNYSSSVENAFTQWMNSPKHKANILAEDYTHIGIAVYEANGTYYWTQVFIGNIDGFNGEYLPSAPIKGDVNLDGTIDAADSSIILGYYSAIQNGQTPNVSADFIYAADYNNDGVIDTLDAAAILDCYTAVMNS